MTFVWLLAVWDQVF